MRKASNNESSFKLNWDGNCKWNIILLLLHAPGSIQHSGQTPFVLCGGMVGSASACTSNTNWLLLRRARLSMFACAMQLSAKQSCAVHCAVVCYKSVLHTLPHSWVAATKQPLYVITHKFLKMHSNRYPTTAVCIALPVKDLILASESSTLSGDCNK